jgi:hypothetical protein
MPNMEAAVEELTQAEVDFTEAAVGSIEGASMQGASMQGASMQGASTAGSMVAASAVAGSTITDFIMGLAAFIAA